MTKKAKIAMAAGVAAAGVAAAVLMRGGAEADGGELYARVVEGPLVISVNEYGSIEPSKEIEVKNELPWETKILTLVPEGTIVTNGQVIATLDVSKKKEECERDEISLENARSSMEVSREEFEITRSQAASDIDKAEEVLTFARQDLDKYVNGEYPARLIEQEGSLAMKAQDVKRAKDKYEWSQKLFKENFISETELEGDELNWKSSQLALENAQRQFALMTNYTHRKELAKLTSDVKQAEMSLERQRIRSASTISKAESALRARTVEYQKQVKRYEDMTNTLAKAVVRAPQNGQVIYVRNWRGLIEPGVEVWRGWEIVRLPSADSFIAKFKIPESSIQSVTTGMTARVRCDALPERVFTGSVRRVAPVPARDDGGDDSRKLYPTEVLIDGGIGELKNGLGCKVEVIVAQYDKAIYVPLQCVVRAGGKSYAWVKGQKGGVQREVEVGLSNGRFVRILSGLKAGEEVMLAPPLSDSASDVDNKLAERPSAKSGGVRESEDGE